VSSSRGGIRSSVNGTRGSIKIMDLVRKSSGVIIGVTRVENDLAADLRALKEAVKFDLKADLRLGDSLIIILSSRKLRCMEIIAQRTYVQAQHSL
jgi:hypothetical protein